MTKQEFLAMSLPYDLVGITQNRLVKINGINYENQLPIIWDSINKEKSDFSGICGLGIMLILRPLSDLTKEIEHKGEKFIPIERLLEDITNAWRLCKLDYPNDSKGLYNDIISNIEACEFWLIQKLIEWHFDLADLISKGEAIDVNTLEVNPYK